MGLTLKGRKSSSGSSRKATRHDDSLFGQDTVELLLAVGEGPIEGFKDGAASFRVGDVPLLDKGSQTPNISNFELRLLKGTNPADSIRLNLGGVSATKNIGLDLRVAGQQIVAQGDKPQIDYIDLRFVVQRLLTVSKEGGEFPIDVQFKVEVKPRSSSTWAIPFDNQPPPPVENTSGASNYRPGATTPGTVINDTYRETYIQADAPTAPQSMGAMWFVSTATNWKPKIWNGTAWIDPTALASGSRSGFPIWTWTDLDGATRTAWYSPGGEAPPPGTLAKGDFLLTPQSGAEVYSYNETSWVGAQEFATPTPAAPGVITINGLTRSSYPKEYRIPVTRINEPYDVRVTRISPASTKDIFRDINFESIQQVNRDLVSFPDLAVIWLTIKATDTFTSIPDFTSIMRGVRIPVPSNHIFNETTNLSEYPGIWDGTFKIAYTNSPAWWAYNFIKNARYGKNSYFPEVPDQWDFYEFGKHCSAHGFRFNEFIQEPRSLNELINYIVGIAGGRYVDRGDGYSTVIWDADNQVAQAIFAPENTIEGSFTYSFTDVTERKNDFKVSFKNPGLNYREDRIRVYDQNTIDNIGRNAEEFVAVGCRDPEEAVKRGRLRLATALTEKIIVSFKTNRIGRYLLPFQAILIADDQSTNVISGRIKNPDALPVGSVSLPLRDQIYLEAGIAYSAQFTVSDGNGGLKVVSYPLTVATPGLQNRLTLTNPLAEPLPEYAVFSIGAPKPFRITSITPSDDDPDQIEITAIEINRLKWAFVDGRVELRDITALQTGVLSKFVYPVTGAKIVPEKTTTGQLNLVATWNPSETKLVRGYRVYQSINMQPMELVGEPSSPLYRITDVKAATYLLSIVAVGLDGTTESAPTTVSYVISNGNTIRSVEPPTNLRLVDEPEAPIFRAVNPRFAWDAAPDPLVAKYLVEVLGPTNTVVYSERVEGQLLFDYTLAQNKASNGGTPLRQFTVRVRSIDSTGAFSAPVTLVVSHPAPAAISFTLDAVSETVFVSTSAPTGDWAGTLVWMEKVSGFNPVTTAAKADARATSFQLPATAETTYFLRAAAYDSYGKTGLNYGTEQSITATNKLFDPNAPARPGKPTLTTGTEIGPDGTLTSWVKAVVPAVTSANLSHYEISWQIASGDWERRKYDTNTATMRGFLPATVVNVKAASISKMNFPSDYSDVASITTAKNLVAPANPTSPKVSAALERSVITWTAPANLDLKWVEVWGADVSSTSATPVGVTGSRLIGTAPKGQTQFWDTMPTTGTRTYWLRSVNTSDVVATSYVRTDPAVTIAIQAQQLAAGVIDATKMATSLEVPRVVSALPTTKTGQFVTLESDGKLYRWDAATSKYVPASLQIGEITGLTADQIASVNAAAVAGQLTDTQLKDISAAKIAGQLAAAQIAAGAISFDKFGIGLEPLANVSALPTVSGYTGPKVVRLTTNGKLYRLVGTAWTTAVDAGDIAGTIQAAQVAALEASKITGQLTNAQLGQIDAAKVAGQLTDTQIAGLSAAKLSGQIVANQLADAAVSLSKFAAGLAPIGEVSALPTVSGYTGPKVVLLTTDGKVYRLIGSMWTTGVTAGDITGTIQAAQVAALEASKITGQLTSAQIATLDAAKVAGQLTDTQIAGISASKLAGQIAASQIADAQLTAAKFASNVRPVEIFASLPTTGNFDGRQVYLTADKKLYRHNGTSFVSAVAATDISGTLQANQIATLTAGQITGALTAAQIASVNATAVAGTLTDAQIAGISAGKVAGALTNATLAAAGLTGTLTDAQIAGLSAAKLAGQITGTQITDNAVTTAKIAANAVTASTIAAGSIVASKLAIATINLCSAGDLSQGLNSVSTQTSGVSGMTGSTLLIQANAGPDRLPAARMNIVGTIASGSFFINVGALSTAGANGLTTRINCTAGQYYEASAYPVAGTAGTQARMEIVFEDNSGATVSAPAGAYVTASNATAGSLDTRPRCFVLVQAPSGATRCYIRVRFVVPTDTVNPALYAGAFMLAPGSAGQTEPSPFVAPGATTIDGGNIVTNSITARSIVANAITANEIAAGTITTTEIKAGTIVAGNIAANAITATQLAANSVSATHIVAGTITATEIASNAVTAAKIIAGAIQTAHMTAGSINADRLVAASITAAQINAGAITTAKLAANAVTANEIAAGTITAAEIKSGTITATQLAANSITTTQLAANSVTANAILAGTITATELAANSIVAGKIAANAVTATTIAAGAVIAGKLAADSVTATNIVAGTITATEIASGAISTAKLAAGAVTAGTIATGAITADKVAANAITATNIVAGTITATELAAGAITADKVAANAILASKIVVADWANLFGNPVFENGSDDAWSSVDQIFDTATNSAGIFATAPSRYVGLSNVTGNTRDIVGTSWIPTQPGEVWYLSADVASGTSSTNATHSLYIRSADGKKDNASPHNIGGSFTPTTTWVNRESSFTVPAGKYFIFAGLRQNSGGTGGNVVYTNFKLRRMASAELIVDGAVVADKIAAGAITAGKIAANAITANNIVAGTITGTEIKAGSITVNHLAVNSVTAAQIVAGTITATEIASGAISTAKLAAGAVTAVTIATGAITAGKVAADAISATNIVAGTITATELAAGTITGDRIAANAITAREMVLTDSQNLLLNGDFRQGRDADWRTGGAMATLNSVVSVASTANAPAANAIEFKASSTTNSLASGSGTNFGTAFGAGDQYYWEAWVYADAAISSRQGFFQGILYPATGAGGGQQGLWWIDSLPARVWTKMSGTTTITAAGRLILNIASNANSTVRFLVTGVRLQRRNGAELIVDGGIVASKLAADSVTANAILAGTITSTEIKAGTITAGNIAAGTITATQIAGATITGNKLVANTITADQIASRTITASEIASGTITGTEIKADTITAGHLKADSVTAAAIKAGAIGVDQLAAGAITADKIGIGLGNGNLLYNSDFQAREANWEYYANSGAAGSRDYTADSPLPGMTRMNLRTGSGWTSGVVQAQYRTILSNGSPGNITVHQGRRYEFSVFCGGSGAIAYLQWLNVDGTVLGTIKSSSDIGQPYKGGTGGLYNSARLCIIGVAPANAVKAALILRSEADAANSLAWFSGAYFGEVKPSRDAVADGAYIFSPYAPSSQTVIDGGVIAANTITATQIAAGTITTDLLSAGNINVDTIAATGSISANKLKADVLTAGSITVSGSTKLSSWASGTEINGGAIKANTIKAGSLEIGSRSISITGLDFTYDSSINRVAWTSGTIGYINDTDGVANQGVGAGAVTFSTAATYYFYWTPGSSALANTTTFNSVVGSGNVHIATYSPATGLVVYRGTTKIDGMRIIAASITADLIAAGAIQTNAMSANSINGDRITAGTLNASKITASSITTTQLGADCVTAAKILAGTITATELAADCITARELKAGTITATSGHIANLAITNAMLGNAAITNAKIGNLAVDNIKIAGEAVSRVAANSAVAGGSVTGKDVSTSINVRGSGKVVLQVFYNPDSTVQVAEAAGQSVGVLTLTRTDSSGAVTTLFNVQSSYYRFTFKDAYHFGMIAHAFAVTDTPAAGAYTYRAVNTSSGGLPARGITIIATELSK